ncbi:unnamed protein product [Musa hybrid cultivar]
MSSSISIWRERERECVCVCVCLDGSWMVCLVVWAAEGEFQRDRIDLPFPLLPSFSTYGFRRSCDSFGIFRRLLNLHLSLSLSLSLSGLWKTTDIIFQMITIRVTETV